MDSDVYTENLLEHYKNPKNIGILKNPNFRAADANTLCGDVIEFQLLVKGNIVKDVRIKAEGCAISKGCASMLSEKIKGLNINEVIKLNENDIFEMLGIHISEARINCALLPLVVLKKAINKKQILFLIIS
ncbi:MAG: iron-sulfur cluster assembly scaffold protein [Nanoarchaeota archaeon]